MFTTGGLFREVPCPDGCNPLFCLFSHESVQNSSRSQSQTVPAKRPPPDQVSRLSSLPRQTPSSSSRQSSSCPENAERPTKLQRVGSAKRPVAVPTASSSSTTGVPILTINAGQSKIPVSTRQNMLKLLYNGFVDLYGAILPERPSLANEHALRQEQEIYERTTKSTYPNVILSTSITSLKQRDRPTSPSHPSVGTAGDLARRKQSDAIAGLRLTASQLQPLLLTRGELPHWNYIVDIPAEWGPGGEFPSAEGQLFTCERCKTPYIVRPLDHEPSIARACEFHWGKPLYRIIEGKRTRGYACCLPSADDHVDGCTRGPHVFYESDPAQLHARHPFTETPPMTTSTLEIAALDCEMVYTTGGFRIARVSVVNAGGEGVFDELIKMDDGVEVVDFNTRFSGIHPDKYATGAVLTLESVRHALGRLIGTDTILIGHALDNDLRALRLIHQRVIDTAALFPHSRGLPYRRALRDLMNEYLSRRIQQGDGLKGHSSVEDSVAALDLVKWFVHNKKTKPALVVPVSSGGSPVAKK
ncbi:ribonuclease H-like protein [Lactarius quietus]|nr:ribonuclease H-like protein [Lactarius quietus]